MLNVISFIRNYSHIIIIGLVCIALWGLNARNGQLMATNDRLEKLANSKDEQINDLRSKNDDLASSVDALVTAVNQQNAVMSQVTEQRAITAQQNRKLQNEIKREAAKSAGGIQGDKKSANQPAGGAYQPH